MKLDDIKIVLVGTTHPGNIGATARAMFNMCFSRLSLVEPQCPVGEVAYARASGANAVLDNRDTCGSLEQAIADCSLVVCTSARRRSLAWPEIGIGDLAAKLLSLEDGARAALVFGREHSGLTNDEIQRGNYMLSIPTNPDFSSLNLAAAVQLVCFEVYRHFAEPVPPARVDPQDKSANSEVVEGFFEHLEQALESSGFLDPAQPGQIMQRLRRLYLRSELSVNEVNILRGMLSAFDKSDR